MKIRFVLSALTAATVLLGTGAALSDTTATTSNQLVDYNKQSGELWAYPVGQGLATYLHKPETVHVLADLSRFAPPDPCRPLAQAWNLTVQFDTKYHVNSRVVFDVLLTVMSDFQCRASVTSVTNGVPQPIVYIQPTAN